MPVTARLSRAFYDRLGDDIVNELVDWFNQVDLTYRSELRELNELNFARFDAKLGERLAQLRAELTEELTRALRTEMDLRFSSVEARFQAMDRRIDLLADQLRDTKTSMLRWMFGFWIGTALVILGSRLAQ
jgi:hypothetical protein